MSENGNYIDGPPFSRENPAQLMITFWSEEDPSSAQVEIETSEWMSSKQVVALAKILMVSLKQEGIYDWFDENRVDPSESPTFEEILSVPAIKQGEQFKKL